MMRVYINIFVSFRFILNFNVIALRARICGDASPIIMSASKCFSAWNSGTFGYQPLFLVVSGLLFTMLFAIFNILRINISVGRSFYFPDFPAIVRMLSSGIETVWSSPFADPF